MTTQPVVSDPTPAPLPVENFGEFGRGWNAALAAVQGTSELPTLAFVRTTYVERAIRLDGGLDAETAGARFDAWLAQFERTAKGEGWDRGYGAGVVDQTRWEMVGRGPIASIPNPYFADGYR